MSKESTMEKDHSVEVHNDRGESGVHGTPIS